ncbi:MAG: nucleoside deaminase [Alphaproteobacteria bacterium]|nr:nucleoside deaminase [Alphaproteobacteria bacterium]
MKIALKEAQKAFEHDEVPVGAIVVDPCSNKIIARASNKGAHKGNACEHAEISAMMKACHKLKKKRLWGMELYVTLEPCTMCAAAASFMRIAKIYFGAEDEKGGAIINGVKFFANPSCHHRPEVEGGILKDECSAILKDFFALKRKKL